MNQAEIDIQRTYWRRALGTVTCEDCRRYRRVLDKDMCFCPPPFELADLKVCNQFASRQHVCTSI